MRFSVQAIQNICIFVVCIWIILLVNNISNLQRINYDHYSSIPFVSTTNFRRDDRNSSNSSSRRRRKESTRQRVYGSYKGNSITARTLYDDNKNDKNSSAADINIKNIDMNNNNNNNNNNSGRQRKQRRRSKIKKRHQDDESTDDDFNIVESSLRSPHTHKSGPDVDLLLPKPIIVMGFPKAGTSSIFTFFQRQGQNTQHWYCCRAQTSPKKGGSSLMSDCLLENLRHNRSKHIFKGCGHSHIDVYSEINGPRKTKFHPRFRQKIGYILDNGTVDYDGPPGKRIFFPQHFRIEEIHESYPKATWILNWRDFDPWIESVIKWGINDHLHYQFLNEYYMQGVIPYIPSKNNISDVKAVMKKIYYEHHDMVRKFVRSHPSHALVEVNITHENASTVLAEAFGLSPNAWTNVNRNKRSLFGTLRQAKRVFRDYEFIGTSTWWILFIITIIYIGRTLGFQWA